MAPQKAEHSRLLALLLKKNHSLETALELVGLEGHSSAEGGAARDLLAAGGKARQRLTPPPPASGHWLPGLLPGA